MDYFCAARTTTYSGDLEALISIYSDKFQALPMGKQDVKKYILLIRDEIAEYCLMISINLHEPANNLIVTVIGPSIEYARQLTEKFEDTIGIRMEPAPQVENNFEHIKKLGLADRLR